MKWRSSSSVTLPAAGFIEPCIPTVAKRAPAHADWIFELKHDGYRLQIRKQATRCASTAAAAPTLPSAFRAS